MRGADSPPKQMKTVKDRVKEYGEQARARTKPFFQKAAVAYPPPKLVLLGLKGERVLQVYASDETNGYRFVRSYPMLAASGGPGPKLREGDRQVPEGIYPIELLNPNSSYHLSLRVDYPNELDRAQAAKEGRKNLGGDIMIHGKAASIGCLAMGDEAAEDLFVLAAETGLQNIKVVLSPVDFRTGAVVPKNAKLPDWTDRLYNQIKTEMAALPVPHAK
jgi:murein L,D-transpeptidase YafK